MLTPKIKKLIEGNPVAFATVDLSGKPNVIPVAYVKVVSDTQILITDNYMNQTKKNLESIFNQKTDQNSAPNLKPCHSVCLAVWNKDWEGHKLIGTAEYFCHGKWVDQIKKMPENKGFPAKGAIIVTIEKIVKLG